MKQLYLVQSEVMGMPERDASWEFKPCPFCGHTDIGISDVIIERYMNADRPCSALTRVWAYCKYCRAEGPKRTCDATYRSEIEATAVVSWNERKEDKDGEKRSV